MTDAEKIALYEDMLGITEDRIRYDALRAAYGLTPAATWLMSRLIAAKGRWLPAGMLLDAMPALDPAKERSAGKHVAVRVWEINRRMGKGFVENDRVLGYRLSASAKDRIDRTLKVHRITWYPDRSPRVVVSIEHEPLRIDEDTVRRILHDPDVPALDRAQIHGRWRAQGG